MEFSPKIKTSSARATNPQLNTEVDLLEDELVEVEKKIDDGNSPVLSPVILPPEFFQCNLWSPLFSSL